MTFIHCHRDDENEEDPSVAARDMEQPNERIATATRNSSRDAHLLPRLCAHEEPFSEPVKDRGKRHPKLRDAKMEVPTR